MVTPDEDPDTVDFANLFGMPGDSRITAALPTGPRSERRFNACLEIEDELRQRSDAAVERLSVRVAGRKGELDNRIRSLPSPEAKRAIGDLYELGWID